MSERLVERLKAKCREVREAQAATVRFAAQQQFDRMCDDLASCHAELLEALAYLISCAPADCEMTKKAREVFAKFGGNHSASLSGGENVR